MAAGSTAAGGAVKYSSAYSCCRRGKGAAEHCAEDGQSGCARCLSTGAAAGGWAAAGWTAAAGTAAPQAGSWQAAAAAVQSSASTCSPTAAGCSTTAASSDAAAASPTHRGGTPCRNCPARGAAQQTGSLARQHGPVCPGLGAGSCDRGAPAAALAAGAAAQGAGSSGGHQVIALGCRHCWYWKGLHCMQHAAEERCLPVLASPARSCQVPPACCLPAALCAHKQQCSA